MLKKMVKVPNFLKNSIITIDIWNELVDNKSTNEESR